MSIREIRKACSLGSDYTLYCPTCMIEVEVYSATGHKENEKNLHCVECGNFVTRLIKTPSGLWQLDMDVYK